MKWTDLLKSEVESTYAVTKALIEQVSDADLAWKPATGSNWMTVGQLLHHLETACGFCMRGFVTGDWGPPPPESAGADAMLPPAEKMPSVNSVAEALAALEGDRRLALQMIDEAGERAISTRKVVAPWNPGTKLPLGQRLLHMLAHLAQHKGQLFYYLKLMGRPVNTGHLWGM